MVLFYSPLTTFVVSSLLLTKVTYIFSQSTLNYQRRSVRDIRTEFQIEQKSIDLDWEKERKYAEVIDSPDDGTLSSRTSMTDPDNKELLEKGVSSGIDDLESRNVFPTKSSGYWTVTVTSSSEATIDIYAPGIYFSPLSFFEVCWKKAGQWWPICNVNMVSLITVGSPNTEYFGQDDPNEPTLHHLAHYIQGLDCGEEYKFKVFSGSAGTSNANQFGSSQYATTSSCDVCDWNDGVTMFLSQYVLQGSILQNSANTCRLHVGNFNGDRKQDILRTCNDEYFNALWHGTSDGNFEYKGNPVPCCVLQNSGWSCQLHVGDFNGDGKDDILRTCINPNYNALWYGTDDGFDGQGYILTGSLLQSSDYDLHIGDFNGDGYDDLLRTHRNDASWNALWHGVDNGFDGQGYVFTGSILEKHSCWAYVGNFRGITRNDYILRACEDRCYNAMYQNPGTSDASGDYTLTGSLLRDTSNNCRIHIGDFDGDNGEDVLRTCNDPAFNTLFMSIN
mmetsp:Transcript_9536/g.12126  ORF Transcript_9536/g.12126 Transcript_9536/m.12126 type:complete len:504 (+) Transcript_9536:104-1615(+)